MKNTYSSFETELNIRKSFLVIGGKIYMICNYSTIRYHIYSVYYCKCHNWSPAECLIQRLYSISTWGSEKILEIMAYKKEAKRNGDYKKLKEDIKAIIIQTITSGRLPCGCLVYVRPHISYTSGISHLIPYKSPMKEICLSISTPSQRGRRNYSKSQFTSCMASIQSWVPTAKVQSLHTVASWPTSWD